MTAFRNVRLIVCLASISASALISGCGGSVDITFVGEDGEGTGGKGGGGEDETCGNGELDGDETCDDGKTEEGDGCDASCAPEPGWVCTGEPSVCVESCGNGKLDDGETCEDGNLTANDGCDASCQIEGSCKAPKKLVFKTDDKGVSTAKVTSTNANGASQVPAADCAGDDAGGGGDRIYELDLESEADVTIKVSSSANLMVRLLDEPCKVTPDSACIDAGGANEDETLVVKNLPAGKHYVVVDGSSEASKGEFTLTVRTTCPLTNVQLSQLNSMYYYALDYNIVLENTSDSCGVNMSLLGLSMHGSSEPRDVPLPDRVIEPGERVSLVFRNDIGDPNEVVLTMPTSLGSYYYGSASAYLCRGACNTSGSNMIDAVQTGSGAQTLPSAVEFEGGPLASITSYAMDSVNDYVRIDNKGKYPKFLASDWGTRLHVRPARIPQGDINNVWPRVGTPTTTFPVDDTYGTFIRIDGTVADYNGYDLPLPAGFKPTLIRMRIRKPSSGSNYPYVAFGASLAGWSTGAALYLDKDGASVTFQGSGISPVPTTLNEWFVAEYRNIVWADDGSAPKVDIYVDGELQGEDLSIANVTSLENLRIAGYNLSPNVIDVAEVLAR